jgi:hypothetical protein
MALIKLLAAPIRRIISFPLFQLAVVLAIILVLQAADDNSLFGRVFEGLDKLVDSTVRLCSEVFSVKSFTRSGLILFFSIAYVYFALLIVLFALRVALRGLVDLVGWSNAFGLRNAIARERGIAAYRAWVPFERIRPAAIPQEQWEETFGWPADNKPPYPPLPYRLLRTTASYLILFLIASILLQLFTPFPVLTLFAKVMKMLLEHAGVFAASKSR